MLQSTRTIKVRGKVYWVSQFDPPFFTANMEGFWGRNSRCALFFVIIIGGILEHLVTHAYMIGNDPKRRAEYLDPDGKYLLEWEPLWATRRILFNVTVQTKGFVAFGLSSGNVTGTSGGGVEVDLIIGGVLRNGKAYFMDHHISGGRDSPRRDLSQDYTLHSAWESRTHTFVSFSRPLDTCDSQDYPITDNRVSVVWGYGEQDNYEAGWQYGKRGRYDLYFLDIDYAPKIVRGPSGDPFLGSGEKLETWTISKQTRIPNNHTAYLCTMHKAPKFQTQQHMVGLDVHFANTDSRQRVHHMIVYKCLAPEGVSSEIFEPFVNGPGQNCYVSSRLATGPMPTHFCTQFFIGWGVGGRATFIPPHIGFPFASDEYFMIQTHYDNPQQRSGIVVDLRMDFFHTSNLRPNEGGVMAVGHDIPGLAPSLLIPPAATNHRIVGHCSPECTKKMYPSNGIKIAGCMLHSHNSGHRLRLRHFSSRDSSREQPWIVYDDNYSNQFQQLRTFRNEFQIHPGDHLIADCVYDNVMRNSSTIVGGYSTSQEMCVAFILYYNKIPDFAFCNSEINSPEYRQRFLGITNMTWMESRLDWVATDANSNLRGLTVKEISDGHVRWDSNTRQQLQRYHETNPHSGRCSRSLFARSPAALAALFASGSGSGPMTQQSPTNVDTPDDHVSPVEYPSRVIPYVPENVCSYRGKGRNNKRVFGFY